MNPNVGSTECYARLAAGLAAGASAARASGWQRVALGTAAVAGIATALTRYCPINQAIGRGLSEDHDEGARDAELRRHAAMNASLGSLPTTDSGQPRVTPHGDVFGRSVTE